MTKELKTLKNKKLTLMELIPVGMIILVCILIYWVLFRNTWGTPEFVTASNEWDFSECVYYEIRFEHPNLTFYVDENMTLFYGKPEPSNCSGTRTYYRFEEEGE